MSKIVNIEEKDAVKAYKEGSEADKVLLKRLFPNINFNPKITDLVKSFEDACSVLGVTPTSILSNNDTTDEMSYKKLKTICKALNESWVPDWNNSSQYKYYPYFDMRNGFSFSDFGYSYSDSRVGSRLCFKSRELAEYAGTKFENLYRDLYTL